MRRRGLKPPEEREAFEAEVLEMHGLHQSGLPLEELARRFGYADGDSIRHAFQRRGLQTFNWPYKWRPEMEAKLREFAADSEMSQREAGLRLGITARTVLRYLDLLGIEWVYVYDEPEHGTRARYNNRNFKCRCDECREAATEYRRQVRAKKWGTPPTSHGCYGYQVHGCRCDECVSSQKKAS